jgi:hypothetical protein
MPNDQSSDQAPGKSVGQSGGDDLDKMLADIRKQKPAPTAGADDLDKMLADIRGASKVRGPASAPSGDLDLRTPEDVPKPFTAASVGLTPIKAASKLVAPSLANMRTVPDPPPTFDNTLTRATGFSDVQGGGSSSSPRKRLVGMPLAPVAATPTPTPDGSDYMKTMRHLPGDQAAALTKPAVEATHVGAETAPTLSHPTIESALQAGLSDMAKPDPSTYAPTSKLGKAAYAVGSMAAHPIATAMAPLDAAWTLGKYAGQENMKDNDIVPTGEPISRRDAAFAAGQLLALGAGPTAGAAVDAVFGAGMAKAANAALAAGETPTRALLAGWAARTAAHAALGGATGAVFSKDDPETGAILGAAIGGIHAAAQGAHVRIPVAEDAAGEGANLSSHPDRLLGGQRSTAPSATATMADRPAASTGPDYSVDHLTPEPSATKASAAPVANGIDHAAVESEIRKRAKFFGHDEDAAVQLYHDELAGKPAATRVAPETAEAPRDTPMEAGIESAAPRPLVPESSGLHVTLDQMLTRNIANGLKTAHPDAIAHAAPEMAQRVPENALLVPLPDHTGSTAANTALAQAIADQHGNADVTDVLTRSARTTDSGELRDKGKPGLTADEHEASLVATGELPKNRPVVFIDNVETTGAGAEGARRVLDRPDAQLVAFAKAPIPAGEVPAVAKADQPKIDKPEPAKSTILDAPTTEAKSDAADRPAGAGSGAGEVPAARAVDAGEDRSVSGRAPEAPRTADQHVERTGAEPRNESGKPGSERTAAATTDAAPESGRAPGSTDEPERAAEAAAAPEASESVTADLAQRPHVPGPIGHDHQVHFSDGSSVKARYRVIEADQLQASHDPTSFAPNAEYPKGVQGREYSGSRGTAARQHVELETGKLRTAPLLDAGGGTTDGPPVITPHGLAVAGNQRAMMLRRATSMAPDRYKSYRDELTDRAHQFGVDPEQVRSMKHPVLVREIADPSVNTNDPKALSRLNQLSDQTPTKTKDSLSDALGRANQMQQAGDALAHFSETISGDDTIREYLGTAAGGQFVRKLLEDGVIAPQERGAFVDSSGSVTPHAKETIEAVLRMAAIGDADIIHRAPPAILRKLESAIPALIQANATKAYALTHEVQSALALLTRVEAMKAEMQARGEKVGGFGLSNYLQQQDMFGNDVPENVSEMASFLENAPKNAITTALRTYAKAAHSATEASQSDDIFGETPEAKPALTKRLFKPGESKNVAEAATPFGQSVWEKDKPFKARSADDIQTDLFGPDAPKDAFRASDPISTDETLQKELAARIASVESEIEKYQTKPLPGEVYTPTAHALAVKVAQDMIAKADAVSLCGAIVNTHADLAAALQITRNPFYETFRVGLQQGAKIVAHSAVSSRMAGTSAIFAKGGSVKDLANYIVDRAIASGADGYHLTHNHPNGVVDASKADKQMTGYLHWAVNKETVRRGLPALTFHGHIIVNHRTYAVLQPHEDAHVGATETRHDLPGQLTRKDPFRIDSPHVAIGQQIGSGDDIARVAQSLNSSPHNATVIWTGLSGVREVGVMSTAWLEHHAKPENHAAAQSAFLEHASSMNGATRAFLVMEDTQSSRAVMQQLMTAGVVVHGAFARQQPDGTTTYDPAPTEWVTFAAANDRTMFGVDPDVALDDRAAVQRVFEPSAVYDAGAKSADAVTSGETEAPDERNSVSRGREDANTAASRRLVGGARERAAAVAAGAEGGRDVAAGGNVPMAANPSRGRLRAPGVRSGRSDADLRSVDGVKAAVREMAGGFGENLFGEQSRDDGPAQGGLFGDDAPASRRSLAETEASARHEIGRLKQELALLNGKDGYGRPVSPAIAARQAARRRDIAGRLAPLEKLVNRGKGISADEMKTRATAGDLFGLSEPSIEYGADEPQPRMSGLHNLSAENLIAADQLGGLPAPSLAVVPEGQPFDNYGQITLIAKGSAFDPKTEPVFDADAYSGRAPQREWKKAPSAPVQKIVDRLRPAMKAIGDHADDVWDNLVNRGRPDEARTALLRSPGAKLTFLREHGQDVQSVHREMPRRSPASEHPAIQAFGKKYGYHADTAWWNEPNHPAMPELRKAVDQSIADHVAQFKGEKARQIMERAHEHLYNHDDGTLAYARVDHLLSDAKNVGKQEVDRHATADKITEAMKGREPAYEAWVDQMLAPFFKDPRVRVGRAAKPWTLGNVTEAAVRGRTIAGAEDTMTHGPGKVRAVGATRFGDINHARNAAGHQIKTPDEVRDATDTFGKDAEEWHDAMLKHYDSGDTWHGLDAMHEALSTWAANKGRLKPNARERMRGAMRKAGFSNVPAPLIDQSIAMANRIMDMPTDYFEAKPQRAVHFDEFAGAVIPKDAPAKVREILDRRGIPYKEYEGEKGRSAVVQDFRRELHGAGHKVLMEPHSPYGAGNLPEQQSMFQAGPPDDEYATGIKNAVSAETRQSLGMPERTRPEPRTQKEMYNAGKAAAVADPTAITRLLADLRDDPERIVGTKIEAGLLLKHRVDLDNKLNELVAAKDAAVKAQDEPAERLARLQLAEHREAVKEFVQLAERTGTASGRALAARKMMSKLDYSLSHMETMAEAAKGSPLTQAELDRIKKLHEEVVAKLAIAEKDLTEANERAAIAEADLAHAQLRATAMQPLMDRVSTKLGSAADQAKARIRARGMRAMAGLDPIDLADHAIIGADALARGIIRFADWSHSMKETFGEEIAPHLRELFDASNAHLNTELKKARALESRKESAKPKEAKAPKGEPKPAPISIRARLQARLDEGASMSDLRPYLRQLALEHIRKGILEREPLLDALHKDVLETGASVTRAQTRDALSGYGEFRTLDKSADKAKLRDIQAEAQKLAQLEALQKGKAPLATGFERQAPNDETRKLTKQVNDAKKAAGLTHGDDASRLKSALGAAKTRMRNAIADLRTEIDTGERQVKGKHVLIGDAELEQLRAELAELRKQESEVFGDRTLTDEQRLARAITAAKRTADQWQDKVAAARQGTFAAPNRLGRTTSPELDAIRARADAAREEYAELRSLDPAQQQLDDQKANQRYRTNLAKREADLLDRLARADYSPRALPPGTRYDSESLKRKADVEDVKQRYQELLRRFEKSNRTVAEKARDASLNFIRAGALSWPTVIAKLTTVALSRIVTTPLSDAAALVVSNALPALAKGAPRYGTRSPMVALQAEAAAQTAMWTDGLADSGRLLRNKQSSLTLLHGKHKLPHEWYEYFGSIHAALKEPVKRAEYARALYRGTVEAMQRGENTTDDFVKLRLSTEAYLHAERAVAMNDNVVVNAWNDGLRRLEQKDKATGKANPLGVFLATALRADMPVVKAPTNVILDASEFIAGLPIGAGRAAWAYANGIEDLKPVERDSIIRMMSKGMVGLAIMALYFYKHNDIDFGGFYQQGERRVAGDVPADAMRVGTHVVPKMFLHNPLFMAAQFAATIARVAPTRMHRRDEDPVGYGSALVASSVGLLDQIPLLGSLVGDTKTLMDPQKRGDFLDKKAASIMVPGVIQWVAKQTDSLDAPRKPVGLKQHIQNNIPIVRGQVPVDEKKQRRLVRLSQQ